MSSRYTTIPTYTNNDGKQLYSPTYYPEIGFREDDTYIITSYNDRLDLIAYDFWGDETLWWAVAMVNDLECDSFFPPVGMQLRVPKDPTIIINTFQKTNEI